MQTVICMEECAELIQELSKKIRYPERNVDNLIDEISDVELCLDSIKIMYGVSKVELNRQKELKLSRLSDRLEE